MKQEDTRQKILAKALELFSVHGYDAVSVGPVSYTHLDVYKRQVEDDAVRVRALPRGRGVGGEAGVDEREGGGIVLSLIHI